MSAKTILITGSTSGIGRAGAEILAQQGWRVLIHARNAERGLPVVDQMRQKVPGAHMELVTGDLSDLKQVAALAAQVQSATPVLDALWNNAGLMVTEGKTSADGFELQWAVNYLAGFLLTSRLLPQLLAAPQARIVQTSSFAHHMGRVPAEPGFQLPETYNGWTTYGDTKLANILFTRELARRLPGSKTTVHAFHPGYVRTEFGSNGNPGHGNSGSWLRFAQIPVEAGAATGVHLVTSEEAGRQTGQYWASLRVRKGSSQINDANAALLWERTEAVLDGRA